MVDRQAVVIRDDTLGKMIEEDVTSMDVSLSTQVCGEFQVVIFILDSITNVKVIWEFSVHSYSCVEISGDNSSTYWISSRRCIFSDLSRKNG